MQEEGSRQPSVARGNKLYSGLALLGLGILIIDFLTKKLALTLPTSGLWLIRGIRFQLAENSGVAFGLGSGWLPIGLQAAAALAILTWLWRIFRQPGESRINYFAGVLIFSGALANIIDRVGDGRVTDFIALGPWPNFNIADSSITVGVALALTATLRQR